MAGGCTDAPRTLTSSSGTFVQAQLGLDGPTRIGDLAVADRPNDALVWTACLATRASLARCTGIVVAIDGDSATVQIDGVAEIAGAELEIAADYYASDVTRGALTTTLPSISGHFIAFIGVALSPNQLTLQLSTPVEVP
jgi:hypothetical protein